MSPRTLGQKIRNVLGWTVVWFVIGFLFVGLPLGITYGVGSFSCSTQWARSGMASDYGLVQGCLVQVKPGQWVPQERVRAIE